MIVLCVFVGNKQDLDIDKHIVDCHEVYSRLSQAGSSELQLALSLGLGFPSIL